MHVHTQTHTHQPPSLFSHPLQGSPDSVHVTVVNKLHPLGRMQPQVNFMQPAMPREKCTESIICIIIYKLTQMGCI